MNKTIAVATGLALLAGGGVFAAPAQASMDVTMKIGITNDSHHAVYVVVDWEGDSSGPSGPVSATAPPQGANDNPWTYPKFPNGTDAFIEVDYEGSGDMKVTTKIYPDADHSFLIGTYWNTFHNGFWSFTDTGNSGTATDWIDAFNDGFGVDAFHINLPQGILDPYYGGLASDSPVGAAVDVDVLGAAADSSSDDGNFVVYDGTSDDTSNSDANTDDAPNGMPGNDPNAWQPSNGDDPNATIVPADPDTPILRSKTITAGGLLVAEKHQARVEKMAAKVHHSGGALTVHAYGPDENLAMDRARAVRAHLEAHLAKRGHVGTSPIYVIYGGDPDHKDTHTTIHWHPDTNLPGAMPGAK